MNRTAKSQQSVDVEQLTDRDKNFLAYIAIRGMIQEQDLPLDSARRLQAHGLIRFDRLGGYYERA